MSWGGRRRYVRVSDRRAQATRKVAKLRRSGREITPVELSGRTIATTFWGKAWCENLEAYSDYANRMPRGRTYVRNGSVVDLQIAPGRITALVSGSQLYEVELTIQPLDAATWQAIRGDCAGQIDSLVELLQGKLSRGVMEIVTRPRGGLFPTPAQIDLDCSCPDWATMCKHVAATLYGVGARLDHAPELLFSLRGVDPSEMVEQAIEHGMTRPPSARGRTLAATDLASIFGVDIDFSDDAIESSPAPSAPDDLPDAARRVFTLVVEEPGLRTPQLLERTTLSRSTVTRALTELKRRGLVTFVGSRRHGGYRSS